MTEIVKGLFGFSPQELAMQRDQELTTKANAFAQLSPEQRATQMLYKGGNQLAGAVGGMLGAQDPQMKKSSDLQGILQGGDLNSVEGLKAMGDKAAALGYGTEAQQMYAKAQEVAQSQAVTRKATAEARKVELSSQQEEQLRTELSALPPNATEQDVMAVMVKYGSPDKVFAALQASQARRDTAEAKVEAAKEAGAAKVEAARVAGATAKEIAQMRADTAKEIAAMRSEDKREAAATKKAEAGNKPLAPSLQKGEDADLAQVDNLSAQQEVLRAAIASVTPDPKTGQSSLVLGPIRNMKYEADNLSGNSTPQSRAYANLKSSVDSAVNLQVSAEKGVQTDADVLRFAKALIAAYGRNDTKATQEALVKYNGAIVTAQNKLKGRIDSRRKSQGVDVYYKDDPTAGTAANPIKLN